MPFGRKKSLMDRAHDYVEQLSDQFTETVIPQIEQVWEQAVDKAGPAISDARDKATPLIEEGRTRAAEAATAGAAVAAAKTAEARDKAAPLLAEYRATAAERASSVAAVAAEQAASTRDAAVAKANELRGVEPEPKGGRFKKFLLISGLLAIGGVVFSKLRAKQDADAGWQSTYVPPAPAKPATPATPAAAAAPVGAATTTVDPNADPLTDPLPDDVSADDVVTVDPPATDDVGGGAPGEAISDAVEGAHEATTPDEPAEIIDIDDVPADKK
ncbi:hypothetical protein [Nocardioides baculatus]|uniref:Uncharacterized protein n=1 Tax=Nocardioides baculatus TaxID=2801337 RepID=A0ABS1L4H1_9ACTN|nr:hypothetical protein [Nocardioides baculatus]MBL0746594.1 hypothetical protein [Nocardioides baculatus]